LRQSRQGQREAKQGGCDGETCHVLSPPRNHSLRGDAALKLRRDLALVADIDHDVIGEELGIARVENDLGILESSIAVAAAKHVVIGGKRIGFRWIERCTSDRDREYALARRLGWIIGEGEARYLREPACDLFDLAYAILQCCLDGLAGDLDLHV